MYIRTKNGVYKIDEIKPYFLDEKQKLFINNELKIAANEKQVINQSENLEELCDEFVCEWFDKKVNRYRHVYCSFKIGQSKELYRRDVPLPPYVDFEIYAGIWINGKGLTYVAKMNKEGDLDPICI